MQRRQCLRRARPDAGSYGDDVDGAPSDDCLNDNHLGTPYEDAAGRRPHHHRNSEQPTTTCAPKQPRNPWHLLCSDLEAMWTFGESASG